MSNERMRIELLKKINKTAYNPEEIDNVVDDRNDGVKNDSIVPEKTTSLIHGRWKKKKKL